MTSSGSPSMTSVPWSSQMTRLQVSLIDCIEWLTRNTVPALSRISRMRASLRGAELAVADRERLVDDQDVVGLDAGEGELEPSRHA